jgi:hypothetical protein
MRNASIDRLVADRRLGLRRAALAAWAIVFALFAAVLIVPSLTGASASRPATPDRAIMSLVAHAVPSADDSCRCDDFDHLAMAPAPALC